MVEAIAAKPFADKNDSKIYRTMYASMYNPSVLFFDYHRFHGWAAARADLTNEENKEQYVLSTHLHCAVFISRHVQIRKFV